MTADTVFYPSISSLLPLEAVPPNLGFIQGVLHDVFDSLYYRDLQIQKSKSGDVGFYQFSLVIYKRLGFEIPGTGGAALVFDPGLSAQTTEIPIALGYRWEILKYINDFDPSALSELPRLLFDAMVEISGADARALLGQLIDFFHGAAPVPVTAFVDAYNLDNAPTPALAYPTNSGLEAAIEDLLAQFNNIQRVDVYELMLAEFLSTATTVEDTFTQISAFFSKWVKDLSIDDFKAFLIPHCSLAIKNIKLALEFPRTLLKPVLPNGDVIDANSTLPEDQRQKSALTFTAGTLSYSTDSGFEFDDLNTFAFSPSQIGETGVIIGFTGMKLDLSRTTNIPEATADGRPLDFVGVYIQTATVILPKKWFSAASGTSPPSTAQVVGTDLIFGTGGTSGKIAFDNPAGALYTKLGNFETKLTAFSIRFERNSIVESNIAGSLTVAGFKNLSGTAAIVTIAAHIAETGDFQVTATDAAGFDLIIPGILDYKLKMLGFGEQDGRFFLETSGTLTFIFNIPMLTFDRPIAVDIKKLIIWQDGKFEIQGGTIVLPKALTLKIGPVKLSVTAISMGSYERNGHSYKCIGFDGGVNVNPGGVQARANGVKVYWRSDLVSPYNLSDLDIFVRIEGIAIDIVIPGGKSAEDATVLISGFLQVKEPDPNPLVASTAGTEYAGGVSFKMPKAGIGGSAAMRLNPAIPNFIIDAELLISTPILLGSTDLGIYGFRGLIGMNYVADRSYAPLNLPTDADWYQYYKAKVPPSYKEGIDIGKFEPRKGFAVGAGLTLGTVSDAARAFSAKLFLLLSLPDALLLQGQAAIMSQRVDLSPDDPPFSVFIAITKQSVEAAFGVNYKLPEGSGEILDLQALIEMGFYFNDSSAWYIDIGRDQPASKRVTAQLFTLFHAWSYLMLSASGIRAGAGVSWDFDKGFGPIHVEAHAYLDTQGRISYKQPHIGAAILLGGSAAIKVFKFKLGVSLAAALAAEAPKPFIVTGSVAVSVDLPKPFRKFGGTVTLDFTWTFNPNPDRDPVQLFDESDVGQGARSVNILTRERFALNVLPASGSLTAFPPPPGPGWNGDFNHFVIPLDATIDIEFKKPIAPGASVTNIGITGTGYDNTELVPPQRGYSSQVGHRYVIEEVKIRSWNGSQWVDYDVYGALTPLQHMPFIDPNDLAGLKQGWWQVDKPGRINKLSLLAQTPLNYAIDIAGPFIPENSGVNAETIFCTDTPVAEQCLVIDELPTLKVLTADQRYALKDVQARVIGADARITPFLNAFGLTNSLALKPNSQLELFFPELTGHVELRLATLADNVTVLYQKRIQSGVNSSRQSIYSYATVKQAVLDCVHLLQPVIYDAADAPIDKVVIVAGRCACLDGVTATAAMTTAVPPQWPAAPACGSVAAYGVNLSAGAQNQLASLQRQYDELIAQANADDVLAAQLGRNTCCDPTLATKYARDAKDARDAAAAMKSQMVALAALIACCQKLATGVAFPAPPIPTPVPSPPPAHAAFPCNIDPKFNYTCMSFVFGICWLPLGDQIYNDSIPSFASVLANNNAMATAIKNSIIPIWRPETIYAVSIKTVDYVTDTQTLYSQTPAYMHFGFRTRGAVGHFAQYRAEYNTLAGQDRADQFRLGSLKPYINYANSYPNADGNVLDAKPLFYKNPKLRIFYIQPYVYMMYGGQFDAYSGNAAVSSTIEVGILDPVNATPASPTDTGFSGAVNLAFATNAAGRSARDVQLLNNMATQGNPCTGVGQDGIAPVGIQSNVTIDPLKPLKLYLAVFKANHKVNNIDDRVEIHRFNFQTSRYGDFPEQVNSYRLTDRDGTYLKDAVFDDIAVTLDATRMTQLTALLGHNYPATDPLLTQYADPFDRLMDGILRTGPIDPAVGTDFNIVRDSSNDKVIGILLRNPEPFNDPKIPAANIDTTIVLSQWNVPPKTFAAIHSKDRSKVFIGDPGLDLVLHDLNFTFNYLEYDGAAYTPASVVTVSLFPTPPPASVIPANTQTMVTP